MNTTIPNFYRYDGNKREKNQTKISTKEYEMKKQMRTKMQKYKGINIETWKTILKRRDRKIK